MGVSCTPFYKCKIVFFNLELACIEYSKINFNCKSRINEYDWCFYYLKVRVGGKDIYANPCPGDSGAGIFYREYSDQSYDKYKLVAVYSGNTKPTDACGKSKMDVFGVHLAEKGSAYPKSVAG